MEKAIRSTYYVQAAVAACAALSIILLIFADEGWEYYALGFIFGANIALYKWADTSRYWMTLLMKQTNTNQSLIDTNNVLLAERRQP